MSVINQMLRDLDARAASDQERAGLPPRLRTLPPGVRVRRQNLTLLAVGMGAGVLLTLLLLLLWRFLSPNSPPPKDSSLAVPAPPAAIAPAPLAAVPVSSPVAVEPPPVVPADASEMKLSTLIAQKKKQPLKPATPTTSPVAPVAKPAPSAPVVAAPANNEGQIDKRNKNEQGHDLAEAEYRKAMQAVKRGDHEAAVPMFKRALEFDPAMARARQGYLSVLVATKRWAEARRTAEEGLNLDPMQTGWANVVARLQFDQGDMAGAIQTLERFAVHASQDAEYQGLFAYLLQKQQRPAEAAERFKSALQLRPNEGRWWFGLGLSLEQLGNPDGAKEAYAKARSTGNLPQDMAATVEQKLK